MKRQIYKPLGILCLALGALGLVLPILPTTPFVLLAAWLFAQSSEKWHRKLMESELFGPMIKNWEENRCISRRTKIVGLCAMLVAGGASIIFAMDDTVLRLVTALLMTIGATVLLLIPTCTDPDECSSRP